MFFHKEYLDLLLVPSGLVIMFAYHIFLLYRYLNLPQTTSLGFENHNKRAWVERIMQVSGDKNYLNTAVSVISSNISAATFLSSVCLTLGSLIGAWLGSSSKNILGNTLIYGDTTADNISVKYISLLTCFLLAFSCFVQSVRHFVHANYLISMPSSNLPVKFVEMALIRGFEFWSLGLRALYFALNLLLWFFGPIPMFLSSLILVIILHHLDYNTTQLHNYSSPESRAAKGAGERISGISQHSLSISS